MGEVGANSGSVIPKYYCSLQYMYFLCTEGHNNRRKSALNNLVGSCCCTLTFQILHFEVYDILKCKNFFIGVFDELGNFKQKPCYISKC